MVFFSGDMLPRVKYSGLENRLAKELASSQSREAIGLAVAKGVTEMVDGS